MSRIRALWVCLAAIGCGGDRMVGTIDANEWPVADSYLVITPEAFGEDDLLAINLSSLPDPCLTWQQWDARAAEAEGPAELAAAWSEIFPVFWEVHIGARVRPATWPVAGTGLAGIEWNEEPDKPDVAFAEFVEHRDHRPEAWFEVDPEEPMDAEQAGEIERSYRSHTGALKWRKVNPGLRTKGRFNTDVVDSDANRLGRVTAIFSAKACPADSPFEWIVPEATEETEETEDSEG